MTFLSFHDDSESNLMFMCLSNNVIFTAATALFDEWLFPRCPKKNQVPPVRHIQEPKEHKIVIETESVPDDDSGACFAPAHDTPWTTMIPHPHMYFTLLHTFWLDSRWTPDGYLDSVWNPLQRESICCLYRLCLDSTILQLNLNKLFIPYDI